MEAISVAHGLVTTDLPKIDKENSAKAERNCEEVDYHAYQFPRRTFLYFIKEPKAEHPADCDYLIDYH